MKTKTRDIITTQQTPGLFEDMDRVFDTLLHRGWLRPLRELWPEFGPATGPVAEFALPRVDVIDRETELLVRAEVPGIGKEDLHIELAGNLLTIRGERRQETKTEEGEVYFAEITQGGFSRTLRLPTEVRPEGVEATFENGLLTIHLPKLAATKRQTIEVK